MSSHCEPSFVGAIDQHVAGAIFQRAVVGDLGRVGVVDHGRRMRRGVAHEVPPVARRAGIGAAIDDQALVRGAHLEGERAGMGDAVHAAAGRAAGIDDHQRGAGGQPLEAAGQRHGRARSRSSPSAPAPGRSACDRPSQAPLNSASPPSPWRKKRSIGAMRSMAATSSAGARRSAEPSAARTSSRWRSTASCRCGARSATMPSCSDVALHELGEPRRASARGSSRSACRRAGRRGRRRSAPSAPATAS